MNPSLPTVGALLTLLLLSLSLQAAEPDIDLGRYENEILRYEAWDKKHDPEKGQILFYGSSSIRLWDLNSFFPNVDRLNRGFGGSTFPEALHYFNRMVTPYAPRQIVLYEGDNDVAAGFSAEAIEANFKEFAGLVQQRFPDTEILFISIKPSGSRAHLWGKSQSVNQAIAEYCDDHEQLTYVDLAAVLLDERGEPREELFIEDRLHLNAKGYELWAQALRPYLAIE